MRRRLWIAAAVILALVAGGLYLKRQTPSYTAASSVALSSQSGQQPDIPTTVKMVTGTKIVAQVAQNLGVSPGVALGSVTVSADPNSATVIDISYRGDSSAAAEGGANAFATALVGVLRDSQNGQVASLRQQLADTQQRINALQAKQAVNPNDQVVQAELTAAVGQYSTTSSEINTLLLAGPPASVLQQATGAASDAASKSNVLAIAGVIGLLVGAGCALLWDQFDTRLRTVTQMEQAGGEVVLVELPFDRSCRGRGNDLPVVDNASTPLAGSIRELRTAVQVLLGDAECPVLVVTSPVPLDGKTLVAANLAASWAMSGKRTVVVSGDLRRPQMDSVFGVAGSKGLAELIEPTGRIPSARVDGDERAPQAEDGPSDADVAALVQETQVQRLSLLPAGSAGSEPADTVAGTVMPAVLRQLRSQADIVIVDTPPVLAVPDAAIIGALADGVIVVARAGKTKSEMLGEAVRRLRAGGVRLLGLVVNQSRTVKKTAYGSYYGQQKNELPLGQSRNTTES